MIYLDNNATTFVSNATTNAMLKWTNIGNPSSSNKQSQKAKQMIENTKQLIRDSTGLSNYEVIFTSGSSEANSFMLRSVVESYRTSKKLKPHIITSSVEHKSVLLCCEYLRTSKLAEITYVPVRKSGHLNLDKYADAFKTNTALVCIMHGNNETGAINPVDKLAKIAHKHGVPFYSDTTQSFGKLEKFPKSLDAMCISAHKFHGPSGIGALVIKKSFLNGLTSLIFGTQNDGHRGGTENVIGIAGMRNALLELKSRTNRYKTLCVLKDYLVQKLKKSFAVQAYASYTQTKDTSIVLFTGTNNNQYLCNTVLLSIVKYSKPYFCNIKIKEQLEKHKIVIGIGSACNTKSKHASHVIDALGVDSVLRRGVLRISLNDKITKKQIDEFVQTLIQIVGKHESS